jgi:hypothetical protein
MTDKPPRRTLTTQIRMIADDMWLEWGEPRKGPNGGLLVWYFVSGKTGEQWFYDTKRMTFRPCTPEEWGT